MIGTMLEGHGYRVLSARNSRDARSILGSAETEVHLLLTDVIMPGLTGPELAQQARQTRPEIEVLFMSGYSEGSEGLSDGKFALIEKPFSADRLLHKLREVLGPSGV